MCILQYSTGSTIAIIGFAVWPDFPNTPSLNHAIKKQPTYGITSIKIISNETVSRDGGAKHTQTRIIASSSIRMVIQGAPLHSLH